jgi:hypothetical protein
MTAYSSCGAIFNMANLIKSLLIGTSVCLGIGTIASSPALAGSLTNPSLSGTASYLTYDVDRTTTFKVDNTPANLAKVLSGDLSNPMGNVELFSNSETLTNSAFAAYTGVSSLTGQIGGRDITLSSLTLADWLSPVGSKTLGQTWFDDMLMANGFSTMVGSAEGTLLFNVFSQHGGFQRFSDPNVAYVNQNDTSGVIKVGLAGHLNATPLFLRSIDAFLSSSASTQSKNLVRALRPVLATKVLQASELIKYTYNNQTGYLYSFTGTNSGLVEKSDGVSHSAIYEVALQGIAPEQPPQQSVPEPALLLGLAGLGAFLASQRQQTKNA